MALPQVGDGEQIGDGNTNETLKVGRSGQSLQIGGTAATLVGFYAATPIAQPASASQAALTLTTSLQSGFGFTTSAAFNAFTAQLENIRASLVLLGLLKGAA